MVQEAKPDCYKQWYLPAGRVEVGESLEEAMKREVSEAEPVRSVCSPSCPQPRPVSPLGFLP